MTTEQRRAILAEVVRNFGRQEWFRDAVVYDSFPTTGEPTLEIKVNYIPLFERKNVMDFAMKVNLTLKFTEVDRNGNLKT
jgi:hypothetical protein